MMESLTDDEIMNDCMKLLELLLVKKLPKPSKIFRSSWMSDPFSCGSYSYLSVDCEEENIGPFDLSVPEYSSSLCSKHPVLLFAGEATHDHYFSTVHGAYETGLREAERIFLHYRKFCKCLHANAMHAKMPNFSRDTSAVKICNTMKLMSEKMADVSLNQKNLGDKLQVVIVGAGLAGLACGLQLFKNNFSNIKILEAQDKIGGRLSSVQFNNYLLELGAQWIHGTTNELFNFAKAHKLVPPVLEEMAYEGEGVFCTSSGKIIESCLAEEVKKILYEAKSELEKGRYDKNTPESVLSFFSKAFDSYINQCKETSNVNIKKALFNWFIKLESIDNACNSMNDIAAQSFTEWDECPEELYHIEFSNGASSLIGTLVSQLPADIFRLNKSVKTVKWSEKLSSDFHDHLFSENRPENSFPVLLQCDDGENIYADSVIVTSSIGFLKENIDSFFSPSLPKNKQEALQSVGFGTVNKIYLIYDQPFWTSEDRGFQLVWENPITGNCKQLSIEHPWINDISGFDALPKFPNILLGWIGGEGAKLMETVEEEVVGNVCSDLLRIFLNQPSIPNPLKVVRSCWYSNPYMRGSYSSRSLNYYQKNSTLCNLQHPLCSSTSVSKIQELGWPTVIFAGEGFDESCFSSAHGAFHSGLKASEQLMTACSNIEDCEDKVCTSENI
ncbi:spermine oxidase [Caerostris extrusa]|uniref:Spermine oxidase n=1 Tax=Caerostris extrusa TaxID=172846 RepID=A0AAV4NIU0_CAEEX|nr:spermine oxidase [Caerostris extrusa]